MRATKQSLATFHEFAPLNKTAEMECIDKLTKMNTAMKKLAPDSGAYMNEVSTCLLLLTHPWRRSTNNSMPELLFREGIPAGVLGGQLQAAAGD
jgi:hypothetical protein